MSIGESSEEVPNAGGLTRLRLPDQGATDADNIAAEPAVAHKTVFHSNGVSVNYREKRALEGVSMEIAEHQATAFIGPSGCGKSTFLLNRMNDWITGFRLGSNT